MHYVLKTLCLHQNALLCKILLILIVNTTVGDMYLLNYDVIELFLLIPTSFEGK